jgi:outer membrane protein TolC
MMLAGCMSVPVPDLPDRTPAVWNQPAPVQRGVAVDARQWWKVLADARLNALVEEAIAGNLDLQQATLRLQAVRLVSGTADARFRPEITASAKQVQDAAAVDTYFHAGVEAIWDLGLFGAAESARLSAQAANGNAEALRNAAQVAVIADVVRSYLDLSVAQAQADLLGKQQAVDARGEQLGLVRQRLHLDEPGELDRLRARQAATRAAIALADENAGNAARATSPTTSNWMRHCWATARPCCKAWLKWKVHWAAWPARTAASNRCRWPMKLPGSRSRDRPGRCSLASPVSSTGWKASVRRCPRRPI